jgi:hypothetical protein
LTILPVISAVSFVGWESLINKSRSNVINFSLPNLAQL